MKEEICEWYSNCGIANRLYVINGHCKSRL